ncbi:MAG: hypothetical protein ACO1OB_28140 [Archangium sp.]
MSVSDEEALRAEVQRLEGELDEVKRTRREGQTSLRTKIETTRAAIVTLVGEVSELESEVLEARRLRDEARDAAKRAQQHADDLKRSGASRGQPRNYWD